MTSHIEPSLPTPPDHPHTTAGAATTCRGRTWQLLKNEGRVLLIASVAATVLLLVASAALCALHPPLTSARLYEIAAASFVVAYVGPSVGKFLASPKTQWEDLAFDVSALWRLHKGTDIDLVSGPSPQGSEQEKHGSIYIGSLPNQLKGDREKLHEKSVTYVYSIIENERLQSQGYSVPYTQADWKKVDITQQTYSFPDHTLPSESDCQLQAMVDDAVEHVRQRCNIFVHCRGGKGRSAIFIHMVLQQLDSDKTVEQLCMQIEGARPGTTVRNKWPVLEQYRVRRLMQLKKKTVEEAIQQVKSERNLNLTKKQKKLHDKADKVLGDPVWRATLPASSSSGGESG